MMRKAFLLTAGFVLALAPTVGLAQMKPTAATYISDEDVKTVNATPGVDRTIRVVDIGPENFAVGVIHRGASNAAGGGAGAGAGRGGAPQGEPCGDSGTPPAGSTPGGIAHDSQTEGYLIISGG